MKIVNDAKIRSVIAGGLGGLLGWLASQTMFGRVESTFQILGVGAIAGIGIAAALGLAEATVLGSLKLAKRGLMIGILVGCVGGLIGAAIGQWTYSTFGGSRASANGELATTGNIFAPKFSEKMQKRLDEAGAHTGDVEIALSWENKNDLDLHVIDPIGTEIYFGKKYSNSGGELDVDRNIVAAAAVDDPVEHVYFPKGAAPYGEYQVSVNHFKNHDNVVDKTAFKVEALVDGTVKSFEGVVKHPEKKLVYRFTRVKKAIEPVVVARSTFNPMSLLSFIVGWTIFGAAVGVAEGLRRQSQQAFRNATLGGAVGGAFGGLGLALFSMASDSVGRMIGFVVLGACICLWIVLVEKALSAFLSVCNGRHEGREIMLDRDRMRLGRSDSVEIFLLGDALIVPEHALIVRSGGTFTLSSVAGSTLVNGEETRQRELRDGDTLQVGETRLRFRNRAAANVQSTPVPRPATTPAKQTPPPPKPLKATSHSIEKDAKQQTSPMPPPPKRKA